MHSDVSDTGKGRTRRSPWPSLASLAPIPNASLTPLPALPTYWRALRASGHGSRVLSMPRMVTSAAPTAPRLASARARSLGDRARTPCFGPSRGGRAAAAGQAGRLQRRDSCEWAPRPLRHKRLRMALTCPHARRPGRPRLLEPTLHPAGPQRLPLARTLAPDGSVGRKPRGLRFGTRIRARRSTGRGPALRRGRRRLSRTG